jgi:hypothetical protein
MQPLQLSPLCQENLSAIKYVHIDLGLCCDACSLPVAGSTGSAFTQIAQELQPKMQQWHNTAAQNVSTGSSSSDLSSDNGSQQPVEPDLEVHGPEYDELMRDVAARIIQTYWGRYKKHLPTMNRTKTSEHVLASRLDPQSRAGQLHRTACYTPEPNTKFSMQLASLMFTDSRCHLSSNLPRCSLSLKLIL